MVLLFLLGGCHKLRDEVDALASAQADQGATLSSVSSTMSDDEAAEDARLDAIETRVTANEAATAELAATVAADEAAILDLQDALVAQEARTQAAETAIAGLEAELGILGEAVGAVADELHAVEATHAAAVYSTSAGTGIATGASWASVTSSPLTFDVGDGDTIVAWCVAVDGTGYAEYRLTATDGTWSASSEALGDGLTLTYPGEALAAVGTFSPPSAGPVTLSCEGKYASPADVTVLALVL